MLPFRTAEFTRWVLDRYAAWRPSTQDRLISISPGLASAASREAIFTVAPKTSSPVTITGPIWKPIRNCPGSPFAGVNSTCNGRKTMDFQHLNGALAYHYRAKRAYFGQYRDRFSILACN